MKKIYLPLTCLLMICLSAAAQIPNPSFENWTGGEPDGWKTFNSSSRIYTSPTSNAHTGGKSCYNTALYVFSSIKVPSISTQFACNCRPTAVHFWYIFNNGGGDSLMTIVFPFKSSYVHGEGYFTATTTNSIYKEAIIDISYFDPGNADSILIQIGLNKGFDAHSINSNFIVDDVSLNPGSSSVTEIQGAMPSGIETVTNNAEGTNAEVIFNIAQTTQASLNLYDLHGRLVKEIANEQFSVGKYKIKLGDYDLPAGMYFCQLKGGLFSSSAKVVVAK